MADQKLVVVKHNDLIRAAQQLTLIEQRIILTCISQIDSKGALTKDDLFSLHLSDIEDYLLDHSNIYANVKDAVDKLAERWVYLQAPSNRTKEMKTRWVYAIFYRENEARIDLYFSPFITPFLSELSRDFTQYKLENVIHFKSAYSTGFYEWLKSFMTSVVILTIDEIKTHFMLENKYERQDVLQEKVIKPALADINKHSDMTVSYETVKQGRKVTGFKFTYVCVENKNVKPKFKKKAPTVKPVEAVKIDDLDHYAGLRKKFGDKAPIPKEFEDELIAQGRW